MNELLKVIYIYIIILVIIISLYALFLNLIVKVYKNLIKRIHFNFFDYIVFGLITVFHIVLVYITLVEYTENYML